jgi:WD40 repeat protein
MNIAPFMLLLALPIAEVKRSEPVDFDQEVLPILKNNCLACHNQTKAKAGLILEIPELILKGGDSGPAVVPGKSAESLLLKAAAHLEDPKMPPKDNKVNAADLKPEELGLLKLWIDQGAKGEVRNSAAIEWQPLPDGLNPIYAVAITADGQFAACGRGNDIHLYSIPLGRLAARLTNAHNDLIQSLAFNPAGDLLASGSYGEVKLWRRTRKEPMSTNAAPEGPMPLFAARPDGKRIAAASNNCVRLWNPEDGKEIALMKGDRYAQERAAQLEREVNFLAGELAYRKSSIENAEKQKKTETERLAKVTETLNTAEKTLQEKKQALASAADTKNGADKVLADLNAELKKITDQFAEAEKLSKQATADAKTSVEKATQAKVAADQTAQTRLEAQRVAAEAAAVAAKTKLSAESKSPAEKPAAEKMAEEADGVAAKAKAFAESVASDAAARQKQAAEAQALAAKMIDEVAAKALALGQIKPAYEKITAESPEKIKQATEKVNEAVKALAKAEKEFKTAEIGRANSEHEVTLVKTALKNAEDSQARAKAAEQQTAEVKTKKEQELDAAKKAAAESERLVQAVAFSADNALLAFADDSGAVHVRTAETGLPVGTLRLGGHASPYLAFAATDDWILERTLAPAVNRVMTVDFSPDGQRLAGGAGEPTRGGEIRVWNVGDGKIIHAFTNMHSDSVLAVDFSPDGTLLASGAADKFVRAIDLSSGKIIKSFEGHTHHVMGVSWKRDGRTLASAGADNVIKVWDFTTGERKKNIDGFGKEVTSINFVGFTDQALVSAGDNQVKLVKENGETVRSFAGGNDFVHSAAATPDGAWVVAGGQDGVLRVWNGKDGTLLSAFAAPNLPSPQAAR